jgi:ketosteroid isomerase-like protein
MRSFVVLMSFVLLGLTSTFNAATASDVAPDALTLAQELTSHGAALMERNDLNGYMAQYLDDAGMIVGSTDSSGRMTTSQTRGMAEIRKSFQFIETMQGLSLQSNVLYARLVKPDVLFIVFTVTLTNSGNVDNPTQIPVSQVRLLTGGEWRIASIQLGFSDNSR